MERDRNSESLSLALSREAAGERILWQARRIPRIEPKGFALYLFAVPWTAFALFWTAMAAGAATAFSDDGKGPGVLTWAFPLFGVPFIVVGLAMLAAPFFGLWAGSRTLYAATERRLLKLTIGKSLKVESVSAERLGPETRTERPDGSGSLSFAVRIGKDSDGDATVERFEISDVPAVFDASRRIAQMRPALSS